jgi:anti-sigma regulatory factor (Ser/Thr protein kinase)
MWRALLDGFASIERDGGAREQRVGRPKETPAVTTTMCPTCGSSVSSADGGVPAICPGCCALLHDAGGLPPTPPSAARGRPRPVLRTPLGRDLDAPAAARHALADLREELGEPRLRLCQLLTSELVTNVVRHAPARSAWNGADMRVRLYPDRVRVEIRDDGPGFEPRARSAGQSPGSGWGLHLLEEMAEGWGVEPGVQNCVWFELRLAREESTLSLH